jgi:hypothetical protein
MRIRRKRKAEAPSFPTPGRQRITIRQEAIDAVMAHFGHTPKPDLDPDAEPVTFRISAVAAEQAIESIHRALDRRRRHA